MDQYMKDLSYTNNCCQKGVTMMENLYSACDNSSSLSPDEISLFTVVLEETNVQIESMRKNAREVLAITECLATIDGVLNNAPAAHDVAFCSSTANLRRTFRRFEAVGNKIRLLLVELAMQDAARIEGQQELDGSGAPAPETETFVEENWLDLDKNQRD